jgi:adenylate kinase
MCKKRVALFILGQTGSGKSRLAETLSSHYAMTHISGGNIMRGLANAPWPPDPLPTAKDGPVLEDILVAREVMQRGIGAPDELVLNLYRRSLSNHRPQQVVFDGNPKDTGQFQKILCLLAECGFTEDEAMAIWLDVPRHVALQRIKEREICGNCGLLILGHGHCPCGGPIVRRTDDIRPDAIDAKIHWFETQVMPVIGYFMDRHRLLQLQANQSVELLTKRVVDWLKL